jgi:2-polyprenyl-6-hydroxyphenyl methylase/3-demethylubiquinone-9 3-methyltransferase
MASRSYYERVWGAVPPGSQPADLALRGAFMLDGLRAAAAQGGAGEPLRVLDVGCGEGQLTVQAARAGFAVVGIDIAEEPLRRGRERCAGLDLRLVDAEAQWPLEDASFDAVWAGETIEHVADTAAWLSQVRRVLRSGGSLLLSTPAHGRLMMLAMALSARRMDEHFDPRSDHLRFYTRRTLAALLADFGFEDIGVRGAGGPPGAPRLLLATALRSRY